eukprot:162056-Rhodomonas_salina.1
MRRNGGSRSAGRERRARRGREGEREREPTLWNGVIVSSSCSTTPPNQYHTSRMVLRAGPVLHELRSYACKASTGVTMLLRVLTKTAKSIPLSLIHISEPTRPRLI